MITARQIKAARALLGWNQAALAKEANVAAVTVQVIEQGRVDPRSSTLGKIQGAFEKEGIEFAQGGVVFTAKHGAAL